MNTRDQHRPGSPRAALPCPRAARVLAVLALACGSAPLRAQEAAPPVLLRDPGLISSRDLLHVRLRELRLDGPAEPMRVRFAKADTGEGLVDIVTQELLEEEPPDLLALRQLAEGDASAQLQVIVRKTDLRWAELITLQSDPEAMANFRPHVLNPLLRGCASAACHGGDQAIGWRFPRGARQSDRYAYTVFVMLNAAQTAHGPMINRAAPERSALLGLMSLDEATPWPHPPTTQRRTPLLRGPRDPQYQAVIDWIAGLRTPEPDYALEYSPPKWLRTRPAATTSAPATAPAAGSAPAPTPGGGASLP